MQAQRKKIYDPAFEEFVDEELPTVSVKGAGRTRGVGSGTEVALASYTGLGGGTVMRVTYLRVAAKEACEFYLKDRDGTFDYPYLEAAGAEVTLGAPYAPIHVVKGTFEIGLVNGGTQGTFIAAYEGIVRFQGTETRG